MQAPPKMGQGAAASKEGALIGFTDSPKKKLENARAQKVTNFKLGHSGKESDSLKLLEPPVLVSAKHADFPSPGEEIYRSFNPSPPPLLSNTGQSNVGIGSPVFRNMKVTTIHKTTFTGPPRGF